MDQHRINQLLLNPESAGAEDFEAVQSMCRQYPYAQTLRVLMAKIAAVLHHEQQKSLLNTAALYVSDRSRLKQYLTDADFRLDSSGRYTSAEDYMTAQAMPTHIVEDSADAPESNTAEPEPGPDEQQAPENNEENSDVIFQEVMDNLQELRKLRQQFEFLDEQQTPDPGNTREIHAEHTPPTYKEEPQNDPNPSELTDEQEDAIAKEIEDYLPPADGPVHASYQIELIDRFINKSPRIRQQENAAAAVEAKPPQDLAQHSTNLNDNLVTENLANIFVAQGKTDKAIDIYKKLIWKFPQKRAYFAAQIEALKK